MNTNYKKDKVVLTLKFNPIIYICLCLYIYLEKKERKKKPK